MRYLHLLWEIPLAIYCFVWAFIVEQKGAIYMAYLNSFACIEWNKYPNSKLKKRDIL